MIKYIKNKLHRPRTKLKTFLIVFCLSLIFIGCATGGALKYWYQTNLQPLSQQSNKVLVTIPSGYSAEQIANLLQSQEVIKSATVFKWYVRFNSLRDNLKAGEYQLDAAFSVPEIARVLTEGQVYTELCTIYPAKRLDQIAKTLQEECAFSSDEVQTALAPSNYPNSAVLAYKPTEASLEGYLYPETFQTTSTTTVSAIIEQSLNQMAEALTQDIINGFEAQGLTVHQGITLASVVEQEASKPDDRKMVAGVFLNRLKIGMMLGSDVTYRYAAAIAGEEPTPFIDSPYNTHKYIGLPIGPISNVSSSSLEAVVEPTASDYLFFVAGDDGTIYYSKTQAEHEAYAREYCKELCDTY